MRYRRRQRPCAIACLASLIRRRRARKPGRRSIRAAAQGRTAETIDAVTSRCHDRVAVGEGIEAPV